MSTEVIYVFNYPDVDETLSTIHDKYIVVPADKTWTISVLILQNHLDNS